MVEYNLKFKNGEIQIIDFDEYNIQLFIDDLVEGACIVLSMSEVIELKTTLDKVCI